MSALAWRWSEFFEAEPVWAPCMLACVIATLVATGYALQASSYGTVKRRVLAVTPAALLTVVSMAILCILVGDAREAHMRLLLEGYLGHRHFDPEHEWLLLLGPIVVVALPTLVLSLGRAVRSSTLKWCAAPTFLSSVVVLIPNHLLSTWGFCCFVCDGYYERMASNSVTRIAWLDVMSTLVVAFGCILAVVFATRAKRRLATPTLTAMLVFTCGSAAFVATRGHATDRHRPFSMASTPASTERFPPTPKWLNECVEESAPVYSVVSFERDYTYVDGYLASDPAALRTELERVRRDWSIIQPGRRFPGRIILRIDLNRTVDDIQTWLDAMHDEHFSSVVVMFDASTKSWTRTRGYVSVRHYCGMELRLTPKRSLGHGTIGDVLQTAIKDGDPAIGVTVSSEVPRLTGHAFDDLFRDVGPGVRVLTTPALSPSTLACALGSCCRAE